MNEKLIFDFVGVVRDDRGSLRSVGCYYREGVVLPDIEETLGLKVVLS